MKKIILVLALLIFGMSVSAQDRHDYTNKLSKKETIAERKARFKNRLLEVLPKTHIFKKHPEQLSIDLSMQNFENKTDLGFGVVYVQYTYNKLGIIVKKNTISFMWELENGEMIIAMS